MHLLFPLFLALSVTGSLVEVDISKVNETLKHFVPYIGYNERSESRHNLPVYYDYSDPKEFKWDSTLSIVQNRTGTVKMSSPRRPQIIDMKEEAWLQYDRNLTLYSLTKQPPQVEVESPYNQQIDQDAPMTHHLYFYSEKIKKEFILTCIKGKLNALSTAYLTISHKDIGDCGQYISAGNTVVAVKNDTKITVYSYYNGPDFTSVIGQYKFFRNIKLADSTSETFQYDPIRMTRDNILYVPVSGSNKVSVFDEKTKYEKEDILSVPFYQEGTTEFLKPLKYSPFENIISYGQVILVGTPGYSTPTLKFCGGGYVFFDNILDPNFHPRFVTIIKINSTIAYSYLGYSASTSAKTAWLGGFHTINTDYTYPSLTTSIKKLTQEYCTYSVCECHNNYTFVNGTCVLNTKQKTSKALIIVLCLISFLLLIGCGVAAILVFGVWRKNKKRTPQTKFKIGNYAYEFTAVDKFPLSLDTNTLSFGYDKTKAPVDEELRQTLRVLNNTKKTYKYSFNPQETENHHFTISFSPKTGKLAAGIFQEIEVKCKFLCTCRPTEIVDLMACQCDDDKAEEEHTAIKIGCESMNSVKLDYEEFVKDRVIGEGSFGVIFLGKYRGNVVAIKKTKNFSWPEDVLENFRKEVVMMNKTRCPYIVNFVGCVDTPDQYAIVTEYAPYGSLKDVYESPKFTDILATKCLTDVANGMVFLHSSLIIHRDLKPENVLVFSMRKKEKVNAKISDFGTSRDISYSNVVSNNGMTQGVGTPLYMAPELLSKEKTEYGQPVDVFAYAILTLEVMTRKVPYLSQTFNHSWDVSDFVIKGGRLDIPKNFPEGISQLIADCWDNDPNKRPKFPEIRDRIEAIWNGLYKKYLDDKSEKEKALNALEASQPHKIDKNEEKKKEKKEEKTPILAVNYEQSSLLTPKEDITVTSVVNDSSLVNVIDEPQVVGHEDVLTAIVDDVF
ncbi:serine-threonine protein kinase, putative [Entamoeba invadens IP1]|uniref:Serine-threonine protein kinase, putative n=1 Tax=Entamoeba invadens IP1 TaxID=370355 RepID=A0A0A1TU65_ENTIV|nr:serine-threonine protein kinase, putative [Entamoeba invadens IP1]ELP83460.1 serine-threonine protein kinase, putative [Entamoeba invadens IP1]|eukprot:XP_004182806.1 serine-threonine protein kinase, putative [Entamoeba invadens IP1]